MGADKSLARPGRKQANVSVRMVWISLSALPWGGGGYLVTAHVSMLLKSHASPTCFWACFLPGRAKDLSAPRYRWYCNMMLACAAGHIQCLAERLYPFVARLCNVWRRKILLWAMDKSKRYTRQFKKSELFQEVMKTWIRWLIGKSQKVFSEPNKHLVGVPEDMWQGFLLHSSQICFICPLINNVTASVIPGCSSGMWWH